ncbi:DegT/DnrJ/EryC1/StrS family aminotransferase [candidate division CSSED10-310 bacterium]|uniref:DegT/DnrJ/EryC1/StrS family aminotransferase n=1 Tax=candidate division CSSED10-310 bacterium TaxID=2855610 RepID=A0ABV6Z3V2_UNCC1
MTERIQKKRIFLSPPHLSGEEIHFVREAFESNYIAPVGPQVDAFEQEFAEKVGIPHTVALVSGTAAMHLAMRILGVGPGDEVIASTLTFIGSVTPAIYQGATPVFIDADRTTWNIDPELLAAELSVSEQRGKLPKVVIPTDLYGQCVDLDRIREVCVPYGIPVVADAAEALGATYKGRQVGIGAQAAIFSFNGNKIITSSGGGMLASADRDLIEQARFLSQQARDPAPHYEHSQLGYNYRMSNIVAAVGRGQLRVLDQRVQRRRAIFDYYQLRLGDLTGIQFMPEAPYGQCSRWLTVILINPAQCGTDREKIRLALENEDIEARPVWKPMHLQPLFRIKDATGKESKDSDIVGSANSEQVSARIIGGEVAENLFAHGLCLPSGTAMSEADLDRITNIIKVQF